VIARIWHGWTTPGNADRYEALLKEEIFAGIQNRRIPGFKSIQLLRRDISDEVEFVTIMVFDSLDAVRELAGEDYEAAVVPRKREQSCLILMNARSIMKLGQREAARVKVYRLSRPRVMMNLSSMAHHWPLNTSLQWTGFA
jgi:heme-degrading monooxygenase HmoA